MDRQVGERQSSNRALLLLKALFAFLALPGVVAFVVPLLLLRPETPTNPFGLESAPPLLLGTGLLLWCIREFYVAGRGTLAPWAPPRHLVTTGPYRYSRNPMYIGVLLIVLGWAIGFRAAGLALYALALAVMFHIRVRWFEEPWLARRHGSSWNAYIGAVPRWLPGRGPGASAS